jgi:hypothetical protein
MSIAEYRIMLMSVSEGQKFTETTREYNKSFLLVSYLDACHTQPYVSFAHSYDHEMGEFLTYKYRAIRSSCLLQLALSLHQRACRLLSVRATGLRPRR